MRLSYSLALLLLVLIPRAGAQARPSPPIQLYGEYSWLSNSFDGLPGLHHPLNGWNAGMAFPAWHHLRFRLDVSAYNGQDSGAKQKAFFILGGAQYDVRFHRELFFGEALLGEGGLNRYWNVHGSPGGTASLTEFLGGGADTPLSRHTAIRIEGGVQHSNFNPVSPTEFALPTYEKGLPNYFGRLSAGLVWLPSLGRVETAPATPRPVQSELVFEDLNSFGHFHIFADSWWSYLHTAGVEYDRHSWGRFLGADLDYSAEILPLLLLRQPSRTDVWGDPLSASKELVPGVGIMPIGMRLIWAEKDRLSPYYVAKGGMTIYTRKAFSQDATHENFALDQSLGVEYHWSDRFGFRAGAGVFHQSDGFIVPSNPGLDEMNWNVGLSYQLGRRRPVR